MNNIALKKSIATLLCHVIKTSNSKDLSVGRDMFFDFMDENFECDIRGVPEAI